MRNLPGVPSTTASNGADQNDAHVLRRSIAREYRSPPGCTQEDAIDLTKDEHDQGHILSSTYESYCHGKPTSSSSNSDNEESADEDSSSDENFDSHESRTIVRSNASSVRSSTKPIGQQLNIQSDDSVHNINGAASSLKCMDLADKKNDSIPNPKKTACHVIVAADPSKASEKQDQNRENTSALMGIYHDGDNIIKAPAAYPSLSTSSVALLNRRHITDLTCIDSSDDEMDLLIDRKRQTELFLSRHKKSSLDCRKSDPTTKLTQQKRDQLPNDQSSQSRTIEDINHSLQKKQHTPIQVGKNASCESQEAPQQLIVAGSQQSNQGTLTENNVDESNKIPQRANVPENAVKKVFQHQHVTAQQVKHNDKSTQLLVPDREAMRRQITPCSLNRMAVKEISYSDMQSASKSNERKSRSETMSHRAEGTDNFPSFDSVSSKISNNRHENKRGVSNLQQNLLPECEQVGLRMDQNLPCNQNNRYTSDSEKATLEEDERDSSQSSSSALAEEGRDAESRMAHNEGERQGTLPKQPQAVLERHNDSKSDYSNLARKLPCKQMEPDKDQQQDPLQSEHEDTFEVPIADSPDSLAPLGQSFNKHSSSPQRSESAGEFNQGRIISHSSLDKNHLSYAQSGKGHGSGTVGSPIDIDSSDDEAACIIDRQKARLEYQRKWHGDGRKTRNEIKTEQQPVSAAQDSLHLLRSEREDRNIENGCQKRTTISDIRSFPRRSEDKGNTEESLSTANGNLIVGPSDKESNHQNGQSIDDTVIVVDVFDSSDDEKACQHDRAVAYAKMKNDQGKAKIKQHCFLTKQHIPTKNEASGAQGFHNNDQLRRDQSLVQPLLKERTTPDPSRNNHSTQRIQLEKVAMPFASQGKNASVNRGNLKEPGFPVSSNERFQTSKRRRSNTLLDRHKSDTMTSRAKLSVSSRKTRDSPIQPKHRNRHSTRQAIKGQLKRRSEAAPQSCYQNPKFLSPFHFFAAVGKINDEKGPSRQDHVIQWSPQRTQTELSHFNCRSSNSETQVSSELFQPSSPMPKTSFFYDDAETLRAYGTPSRCSPQTWQDPSFIKFAQYESVCASRHRIPETYLDNNVQGSNPAFPHVFSRVESLTQKKFSTDGTFVEDFAVYGHNDDTLHYFKASIQQSRIPGAGYGAFLTYVGTKELKETSKELHDNIEEFFDECHEFDEPLQAVIEEGQSGVTVHLTVDKFCSMTNLNAFISPDDVKNDSVLRSGDQRVRICGANLPSDLERKAYFVTDPELRMGKLGIHMVSDYKWKRTHPLLEVCLDLGRYGPFRVEDRKAEELFCLKNFLFSFEPHEWDFSVEEPLQGSMQMIDITDEKTGKPHELAKQEIAMYVNEVGHNRAYKQNVFPCDDSERVIKYFFYDSMKPGETVELLTNYGALYEDVRERKGYGLRNLHEGLGGDDCLSQRLQRNFAARHDIEEIVSSETSLQKLSSYLKFLQFECWLPISDEICRFLEGQDSQSVLSNTQWIVARRIQWMVNIFRQRIELFDNAPREDNLFNRIIIHNMKTALDAIQRRAVIFHFVEDREIFDKTGKSVNHAISEEIIEEIGYYLQKEMPMLMDTSIYCKIATRLIDKLSMIVAKSLSSGLGNKGVERQQTMKALRSSFYEVGLSAVNQVREAVTRFSSDPKNSDLIFTSGAREGSYLSGSVLKAFELVKRSSAFFLDNTNIPKGFIAAIIEKIAYFDALIMGGIEPFWDQNIAPLKIEDSFVMIKFAGFSGFKELHDLGSAPKSLSATPRNGISINETWYIVWQVFWPIHCFAVKFLDEAVYSLSVLSSLLGINIELAQFAAARGMRVVDAEMRHRINELMLPGCAHKSARGAKKRKLNNLSNGGVRPKPQNVSVKSDRPPASLIYEGKVRSFPPELSPPPLGWSEKTYQRQSGASKGGTDTYWYSPQGKKLRSHNEIRRFFAALSITNGDEDAAWRARHG